MGMGFGEKTWFECVECDGRWTNSNGLEFDDKPGGMGWARKLEVGWGIRGRTPRGTVLVLLGNGGVPGRNGQLSAGGRASVLKRWEPVRRPDWISRR